MQTRLLKRDSDQDSDSRGRWIVIWVADLSTPENRQFVTGAVSQAEACGLMPVVIPTLSLEQNARVSSLAEIARGFEHHADGSVVYCADRDGDWAAALVAAVPQMPFVAAGVAVRGAQQLANISKKAADVKAGAGQALPPEWVLGSDAVAALAEMLAGDGVDHDLAAPDMGPSQADAPVVPDYGSGSDLGRYAAFTRDLMAQTSVSDLADLFALHLPKLGITHSVVVRAFDGDAPAREARDGGRAVLAYADGVIAQGAQELLADDAESRRLWQWLAGPGVSLVLQPLVCGKQFLGLVLFGPWRGDGGTVNATDPSALEMLADSVAGVLFREALVREAEGSRQDVPSTPVRQQNSEAAMTEVELTRRIVDRVQQAPDTEAVLRIALEELSEVLGATGAVARLGSRDELLAQGVGSAGTRHRSAGTDQRDGAVGVIAPSQDSGGEDQR